MRILHPIEDKPAKNMHKKFFVIDIETKNGLSPKPDNFVFAVIYGHKYSKVLYSVDEVKEELLRGKYRGKYVFAHNAEFDLSGIFGNVILDVDNSAIFNGKFIMAKYGKVKLVDSTNILLVGVKKLGDILGLPKLDIDESYISGDNVKVTPKMIEYCTRDCEIVYKSLNNVFEMVGGIRITLASLSMFYFRKDFLDKPIVYNALNDEFFDSYTGGRTEVFKLGKGRFKVYDINSLYPYVMTKLRFPDFKNLRKMVYVDIRQAKLLIRRKEGMFTGLVRHKETYVGYLPYKDESKGKLLFPVGTMRGSWNFNELRFAIDEGVVEILECKSVIYGSPVESPFISYITELYGLRMETSDEFERFFYKIMMNSLYGRFGMRKKYSSTYFDSIPHDIIRVLKRTGVKYELKLFSHERNDCYLISENKHMEKMFFSIPSIASYITSAARLETLKGILKNQKIVGYCDTDSIFVNGEVEGIEQGNELGQWKLEDKEICDIRAAKNYSVMNGAKEEKIIKGVPKRSKEVSPFVFEVEKYYKTKEAIRRQKTTGDKFIQRKTITNKYDKRIILANGNTKPLIFKDD